MYAVSSLSSPGRRSDIAVSNTCVVICGDETEGVGIFAAASWTCWDVLLVSGQTCHSSQARFVFAADRSNIAATAVFQDDKVRLRKERRAKLGEDLLSVSGDVPFKFPPTFTFVFRAFTSLDGIGKGLDTK